MGQAVPDGLAAMPPGPELAAVLGSLELTRVPNDAIVDVLVAQSRQVAHEQARLLATMVEVLHCRPFAGALEVRRADAPEPHAADEVRAALAWTRRAAERETDLASCLVRRLPLVFTALLEGRIDHPKAWVFAQHLCDLTEAQIEVICRAVLPLAGRLTTGQIADRLKRMIIEIDPAYYQRRYRKAFRDRQVIGYLDADGTATITAKGLPAEEAAAALERVDALARAARRAGHPSTLDQLRADVVLGLLDGSLHNLNREQILDTLLSRRTGGGPDADEPERVAEPGPTEPAMSDPATTEAAASGAETGAAAPPGADQPDVATEDQRAAVEIRVGVTTLLGHDDRPGEIPGWGPVTAAAARRAVFRQRRAQWRYAVVDDTEGQLVSEGITRRRPRHLSRSGPSGGIVELQVPESALADLTDDLAACGMWATVVADIAARHRRHQKAGGDPDLDANPGDRFPRAALRRHVQVRDRTCTFPGCRIPARRSDQDHTLDHGLGGTTTADDLSPACRHDHILKHEGGWELRQPDPGSFIWCSPLGRTYPVAPEPVHREPETGFDEPAASTDQASEPHVQGRAPPPDPPPSEDVDDPPPS